MVKYCIVDNFLSKIFSKISWKWRFRPNAQKWNAGFVKFFEKYAQKSIFRKFFFTKFFWMFFEYFLKIFWIRVPPPRKKSWLRPLVKDIARRKKEASAVQGSNLAFPAEHGAIDNKCSFIAHEINLLSWNYHNGKLLTFCNAAVTSRTFASIYLRRRASRAFCRWTNRGVSLVAVNDATAYSYARMPWILMRQESSFITLMYWSLRLYIE